MLKREQKSPGESIMRFAEGLLWWNGLLRTRHYAVSTPTEPSSATFPNSLDVIKDRLSIEDPDVVKTMYDAAVSLSTRDEQRVRDTDAKAATLIAQGATIGSVMIAAAALLLKGSSEPQPVSDSAATTSVALLLAFMAIILAVVQALRAAAVRADWRTVHEDAFFCKSILDKKKEIGVEYQRFMILHIWDVYRRNSAVADMKAKRLVIAQRCLMAYFFFMGVAALSLTLSKLVS